MKEFLISGIFCVLYFGMKKRTFYVEVKEINQPYRDKYVLYGRSATKKYLLLIDEHPF